MLHIQIQVNGSKSLIERIAHRYGEPNWAARYSNGIDLDLTKGPAYYCPQPNSSHIGFISPRLLSMYHLPELWGDCCCNSPSCDVLLKQFFPKDSLYFDDYYGFNDRLQEKETFRVCSRNKYCEDSMCLHNSTISHDIKFISVLRHQLSLLARNEDCFMVALRAYDVLFDRCFLYYSVSQPERLCRQQHFELANPRELAISWLGERQEGYWLSELNGDQDEIAQFLGLAAEKGFFLNQTHIRNLIAKGHLKAEDVAQIQLHTRVKWSEPLASELNFEAVNDLMTNFIGILTDNGGDSDPMILVSDGWPKPEFTKA